MIYWDGGGIYPHICLSTSQDKPAHCQDQMNIIRKYFYLETFFSGWVREGVKKMSLSAVVFFY